MKVGGSTCHNYFQMKSAFFRHYFYTVLIGASIPLFIPACNSNKGKGKPEETTTSGTINISVDESFKPVIDSQIEVFESQHPDAHIKVQYKPEAQSLRDLNVDSIRMLIVTMAL